MLLLVSHLTGTLQHKIIIGKAGLFTRLNGRVEPLQSPVLYGRLPVFNTFYTSTGARNMLPD